MIAPPCLPVYTHEQVHHFEVLFHLVAVALVIYTTPLNPIVIAEHSDKDKLDGIDEQLGAVLGGSW